MTSTATHADQIAGVAAAQLSAPPARTIVAASGGSPTISREPPGQWAQATDARQSAKDGKPAAKFAAVSMATRIRELAKWIAVQPNFTFADAAAASAPSPCSPTVMAYTLQDARLASAVAELGCLMTAGGKNGYTVTAIESAARPEASSAASTPAGS
jgi:hypothetical protein